MEQTAEAPSLQSGKATHSRKAFDLSRPLPARIPVEDDSKPEDTATPEKKPEEPAKAAPQPEKEAEDKKVDWEKRYADLMSYKDKQENILKSQLQTLQEALAEKEETLKAVKSTQRQLPLTDEEFNELAQNFPNMDSLSHVRAAKVVEEATAPLKQEIDMLKQMLKAKQENEAKEQLRRMHPDFERLEKDPEFISWFQEQPKGVKSLIESSDIYEIARGLDFYKKDKGIKSKKETELEASLAVKVDAPLKPEPAKPKVWKYSEIKRMSPTERAAKINEINKAIEEGRINMKE